jgi:RNA polymerase sigma factor (sigma-70 family)
MRLSPSIALLRSQSDDRLVTLAREGWEPAFTALVERYRRLVVRVCSRVLPEARAEDATQQVFLAAWKALRRGDEVREVRPWLLRIARNTALNALRSPGYDYDELAESLQTAEAPQAELERREVVRATLSGLAGLPERQREALLRSALEGASHAEIAVGLGIKEGAARQLVLRARTTMRGAVTALTPSPLVGWALSRAGDTRLPDAIAGGTAAAGTGGALLAKVGVLAVVAGGAATPVVVHHRRAPAAAAAATERPPGSHRPASERARAVVTSAAVPSPAAMPIRAKAQQTPSTTVRRAPNAQRRQRASPQVQEHARRGPSEPEVDDHRDHEPDDDEVAGNRTPEVSSDDHRESTRGRGHGEDGDAPAAAVPELDTTVTTGVDDDSVSDSPGSGTSGSGSSPSGSGDDREASRSADPPEDELDG